MVFSELIEKIHHEINFNLPGERAHDLMAPYKRESAKKVLSSDKTPRYGAVMMLLYEKESLPHFVLIQRPEYEGVHGGQVSFPGGKREENEALKITAMRETREEIGVPEDDIQVLGELTQVYIPPSNFLISPFVGFLDQAPTFIPDAREVDEIVEVPVFDLLNDELILEKDIMVGKDPKSRFSIKVPYFQLNYKTVWGATAVMLSEVRSILQQVKG